ncbi:uncharacterized protein LOC116346738 [Contarinia nasturtii]|uniref:uncharacterized protein LOC116346738 n=1 Tax=Contarinia nasturtii TaxID=265458 RepID=UPI0012D3DD19|nr:uncharacterized protein LOC116346738 [Contarinia nasturtii]
MFGCNFFAIAVLVLAISLQQALAIKCWNCASNEKEFCNDPFDPSSLTEADKNTFYVDCPLGQFNSTDTSSEQRAVCKKMKKMVDDKYIVTRSCDWESVNSVKNECLNQTSPLVTTFFCETCIIDGCNGESMN